jgi:cation transport ATPase
MAAVDLSVTFPRPGVIRLQSQSFFGDVESPGCLRFLDRVFQADEITAVTIRGGRAPHADLRFCTKTSRLDRVVERVVALLRLDTDRPGPSPNSGATARDRKGVVRYFRYGAVVTGWKIKLDRPGRLRLKNRVLYRKSALCGAIERELKGVLGIDRYQTSSFTCTVQVDYDPAQLAKPDVIEMLDAAIAGAEHPRRLDKLDLHLPICTASMPIAAAAQFAFPALLPVAAALFAYTSIPTIREAHRVLSRERRLGVDLLDSVVAIGCLGTMSIFPGAVLRWCLGFGRVLVDRSQDHSKKLLLDTFGKQPRHATLYRDGAEVRVPIDRLRKGELIVVNAGEVVPVDGHIVAGMALIDPHALTGESATAESGVGDRVFASTLMLAGRVYVSLEAAGGETASAQIGRILNDAAGHKLSSQERGERLADKAVIPILALGAIGMAAMGPGGALAVLHRDFGSGIRMGAPLAMLGALALCAHTGILVKDGRALELMNEVDAVVFDGSGGSVGERPEFREIVRGLRRRGIPHIAIISGDHEAPARELAEFAGMDRDFARVRPADKADYVEKLRKEGRKVCFVGDGVDDSITPGKADVSISLRGASSIAADTAHVVLLAGGLEKLCELRDVARDLGRNVERSRTMILVPNIACIAGVFTMGFGIIASIVTNNVAALAALGNGVLPLREVAQLEAERRHLRQIHRTVAAERGLFEAPEPATPCDPSSGRAELASTESAAYDRDEWDLGCSASPAGRSGHHSSTGR